MCSSKIRGSDTNYNSSATDTNMDHHHHQINQLTTTTTTTTTTVAKINGRPVLQPTCNRVMMVVQHPQLRRIKKPLPLIRSPTNNFIPSSPIPSPKQTSPSPIPSPKKTYSSPSPIPSLARTTSTRSLPTPPISPKTKSSSSSSSSSPRATQHAKKTTACTPQFKSLSSSSAAALTRSYSSSSIITKRGGGGGPPGSIAEARRMEVANMQVMRKMKIAHYGRKTTAAAANSVGDAVGSNDNNTWREDHNKCFLITPTSDPIYVAYHDQEWGVPVHDDKVLFELLVLTSAQLGSDWTTILKKRHLLRDAFSGFDPQLVASFGEKKITSISTQCGLEISQVRAAVDNANQILKIKQEFGSFSSYLWRYVNNKPMVTGYKSCNKIPVKTSKSESISKDLVKRGMRYVGAAVVHSFMQAAGLTNDHILSCPRRHTTTTCCSTTTAGPCES